MKARIIWFPEKLSYIDFDSLQDKIEWDQEHLKTVRKYMKENPEIPEKLHQQILEVCNIAPAKETQAEKLAEKAEAATTEAPAKKTTKSKKKH